MTAKLELFDGIESNPELEQVYIDPEQPEREFYLPERLDLMVTGRCILRCAGCWGPSHNSVEPEITPTQWLDVVKFVDLNNRSDRFMTSLMASRRATVCITGGEPLMYKGLTELAQGLKNQGIPTTLSTTGHDPEGLLPGVLPNLQELGIPIDGAGPTANAQWRNGKLKDGGLGAALSALLLAQNDYPGVQLTLRTVVHADNFASIPGIPDLLTKSGIDTSAINWKFYLHNASTGPRQSDQKLWPAADQLEWLADRIAEHEPDFKSLATLVPAMPQDRLVINHTGDSYIVLPKEQGGTEDILLGNIVTNPVGVIKLLNDDYPDFVTYACTRAANFAFLKQVEEAGSFNPLLGRGGSLV